MPIKFRTAEESDWEALCRVDGRNFGFGYTPEQIEKTRAIHDVSRFELAFDGHEIVAVVGVFTLQVTVPGARHLPMGGLTWVSTSATHRRQGLLTQLMARSLADVDRRGEPVAMLGASEGAIYERYGFGVATQLRVTSIDRRLVQVRPEFRPKRGRVRFVDGDKARSHVEEVWSRFHRNRVGEVDRSDALHQYLFDERAIERDGFYVRVPAGKQFYLYITQTVDEDDAKIGGTLTAALHAADDVSPTPSPGPQRAFVAPIPDSMVAPRDSAPSILQPSTTR